MFWVGGRGGGATSGTGGYAPAHRQLSLSQDHVVADGVSASGTLHRTGSDPVQHQQRHQQFGVGSAGGGDDGEVARPTTSGGRAGSSVWGSGPRALTGGEVLGPGGGFGERRASFAEVVEAGRSASAGRPGGVGWRI